MYYTYRNCDIAIDNHPYYVNSLSLSVDAAIEGSFQHDKSLPDYYVAGAGRAGSAKMSYYITGEDVLKNYFSDDTRFLRLSFGGLSFQSGCVTSYSLEGAPNAPLIADAEISFYGDVEGTFVPTYNTPKQPNFLNYSECFITGIGFGDLSAVKSFSYRATMNVQEGYKDTEERSVVSPDFITFGSQQASLTLKYDNLTGAIPVSGREGRLSVMRGAIEIVPSMSGRIVSKTIDINPKGLIESSVTIQQENIITPPTIYGFFPTGTTYLGQVIISGSNLRNARQIYYDKILLNTAGSYIPAREAIVVNVRARSPKSGQFKIITQGGVATSTGYFTLIGSAPNNF